MAQKLPGGSCAGPGGPSCSCWHPCIGDACAVMWSLTTWIWRHVNRVPWAVKLNQYRTFYQHTWAKIRRHFWVVPLPSKDIASRILDNIFLGLGIPTYTFICHWGRKTRWKIFCCSVQLQGGRWQHAMLLLRDLEVELQSETWMWQGCHSQGCKCVKLAREWNVTLDMNHCLIDQLEPKKDDDVCCIFCFVLVLLIMDQVMEMNLKVKKIMIATIQSCGFRKRNCSGCGKLQLHCQLCRLGLCCTSVGCGTGRLWVSSKEEWGGRILIFSPRQRYLYENEKRICWMFMHILRLRLEYMWIGTISKVKVVQLKMLL